MNNIKNIQAEGTAVAQLSNMQTPMDMWPAG